MPPLQPVHIEYSSTALIGKDASAIVAKAQDACRQHGFTFGVQVHNVAPLAQVENLPSLGIPFTVHAPILSEFMINLAAEDSKAAFDSADTTVGWMRKLGASLAVFHGFIMTDEPIPAFNQERPFDECFRKAFRKELVHRRLNALRRFHGHRGVRHQGIPA